MDFVEAEIRNEVNVPIFFPDQVSEMRFLGHLPESMSYSLNPSD
jgi:hypothetical protein